MLSIDTVSWALTTETERDRQKQLMKIMAALKLIIGVPAQERSPGMREKQHAGHDSVLTNQRTRLLKMRAKHATIVANSR
ncbi:MAG: hypothetical protein EBX30_15330 [Betaproteobacteria bacterium]|nr:hypothetical protein [Betaproteobacteria bacterium]